MNYPEDAKKLHEKIQKKILFMLPEKWNKLYLYASVIDRLNEFQTGEMFFYYFPKGILKKKPVNVYEIPKKFNIDEIQYSKYTDSLYNELKKLRHSCIKNKEKPWNNITIIIEDLKYKVIYGYEDLASEELNIEERRMIWLYKYLKIPYASLNKREKEIIDMYGNVEDKIAFEMELQTKPWDKEIENIKTIEKKLEFVTEDIIEEIEFKNNHIPKSQILNSK